MSALKSTGYALWLRVSVALLATQGVPAEAGSLLVRNKTARGPEKLLWLFTPSPLPVDPPASTLLVVPLLGPQGELQPDGSVLIWVGRNDGEPLAQLDVTVRVPALETGNTLAVAGLRATSVRLRTDAHGLCRAVFAAPNKPKEKDGNTGSGPDPE